MSYDPHREDYQRLGLRFARTVDDGDAFQAARAYASFGRRFSQSRDSLPQTDGDRAFHLVAQATDLIDYQLPFAPENACGGIMDEAASLLDEAIALDPTCYDAIRMKAAADCGSFDDYYQLLSSRVDEVRLSCTTARDEARAKGSGQSEALEADLAMRPLVRWLSTLASRALICGRYRRCLSLCDELLDMDPSDPSDVRLTAALACAKLEDESALDELATRCAPIGRSDGSEDPWFRLARVALAFKEDDRATADSILQGIVTDFPRAGLTLSRQDELPDGVFARIVVLPRSEDELILAVSESTVVLEEGRDSSDLGSLGAWIAHHPVVVRATQADIPTMRLASTDADGRN